MVQDVSDVVDSGFMNVFEFTKIAGKFACSAYFILSESPEAALPLVAFTGLTGVYVALKYEENVELQEREGDELAGILEVVSEGSGKYRLVADYFLRPMLQQSLQNKIDRLNDASVPVAMSEVS